MKGIIVKWDDEKGYGFIRIDGSKQEIFCHISDFSQRSPRPELNEAVGFEVSANGKGKNVAKQIRYLNREARDFKRNHNHRSSAKKKSFFALEFVVFHIDEIGRVGTFRVNWLSDISIRRSKISP